MRQCELSADTIVIIIFDFVVLGDVTTLRRLVLILLNNGSVVGTDSLLSLSIESYMRILKLLGGLQLSDQVVHVIALTSLKKHVIFIDLANLGDEVLRVLSEPVDGHVDLLRKVVLERICPGQRSKVLALDGVLFDTIDLSIGSCTVVELI